MKRVSLAELDKQSYDVVVIGTGLAGSSAARELVSRGYHVLAVDKADYASGSTGRSDRLFPLGFEYLDLDRPLLRHLSDPKRFLSACSYLRTSQQAATDAAKKMPERVRNVRFCLPVFQDGPFRVARLRVAEMFVRTLGVKLGFEFLKPNEISELPLMNLVRSPTSLKCVAVFSGRQADWPERIALDTLFEAGQAGATIRSYTPAVGLRRDSEGIWYVKLADRTPGASGTGEAEVAARAVVNAAGPWIDSVVRMVQADTAPIVFPIKSSYIAVRLPKECRDWGVVTANQENTPLFVVPWRDLHFIGPRDTPYTDEPDDARVSDDDITWLLKQANFAMPAMGLQPNNVQHAWVGVCPTAVNAKFPLGDRQPKVWEFADRQLPNLFAITGANLGTHEWLAQQIGIEVRKRVEPTHEPRVTQAPPRQATDRRLGRHVSDGQTSVTLGSLRFAAENEQPLSLADLLFRRVGTGWETRLGAGLAHAVADNVADLFGWESAQIEKQVREYHAIARGCFRLSASAFATIPASEAVGGETTATPAPASATAAKPTTSGTKKPAEPATGIPGTKPPANAQAAKTPATKPPAGSPTKTTPATSTKPTGSTTAKPTSARAPSAEAAKTPAIKPSPKASPNHPPAQPGPSQDDPH